MVGNWVVSNIDMDEDEQTMRALYLSFMVRSFISRQFNEQYSKFIIDYHYTEERLFDEMLELVGYVSYYLIKSLEKDLITMNVAEDEIGDKLLDFEILLGLQFDVAYSSIEFSKIVEIYNNPFDYLDDNEINDSIIEEWKIYNTKNGEIWDTFSVENFYTFRINEKFQHVTDKEKVIDNLRFYYMDIGFVTYEYAFKKIRLSKSKRMCRRYYNFYSE